MMQAPFSNLAGHPLVKPSVFSAWSGSPGPKLAGKGKKPVPKSTDTNRARLQLELALAEIKDPTRPAQARRCIAPISRR